MQGLLQLFYTHVVHLLIADRAAFESLRCCSLTDSHSIDTFIDFAPGLLLLPAAVTICVTVTWRIRRQTRHKTSDGHIGCELVQGKCISLMSCLLRSYTPHTVSHNTNGFCCVSKSVAEVTSSRASSSVRGPVKVYLLWRSTGRRIAFSQT